MSEENREVIVHNEGTPRWIGLVVAVLAAVALIALGVGWSAVNRSKALEDSSATQVRALQQHIDTVSQRLSQAEDTNAQMQGQLNVVTDRLKLTQGELTSARRQATQIRRNYDKQLQDMQTSMKADLETGLSTKASTEDVSKLNGDVSNVKSDLDSTKNNLQMAKGELGTLIAKNHEEVEELRRLGQRDYFEFTISRTKAPQKVGDIQVLLRGTNPKRNSFSVSIIADDKRYDKNNRASNEPIYFYTHGSRAPLELVVNQVQRDKIVGYVSVPKSIATPATGGF